MSKLAVVIPLTAALALTTGCKRREASETEPNIYDPNVDPPASVLRHNPNQGLLDDQAAISRRAEPIAPAEAAPSGDPVEQVKALVATAIEDAIEGEPDSMLALLASDLAEGLKPFFDGMAEAENKKAELDQLISDKLAIQMPLSVASIFAFASQLQLPGGPMKLEDVSIDDMQFELVDENVVVTDPDGTETTFVFTEDGYRVSLGDQEIPEQLTEVMVERTQAEIKLIDQLIAGINDETITADNFEQKAEQLNEELLAPMTAKMFNAMALMGAEAEGVDDSAEDVPETDEDATDETAVDEPADTADESDEATEEAFDSDIEQETDSPEDADEADTAEDE